MEAWPIEEIWIRPLGTVLLCALLPLATAGALRRFLSGDPLLSSRALGPVRAVQNAIAWTLGATALGPALVESPDGLASHAFAFLCLAVAVASDVRFAARDVETRPRALAVGLLVTATVSVGLVLFVEDLAPSRFWFGVPILLVAGVFAYGPWSLSGAATGLAIGMTTALFLVVLAALPASLTQISREDAPHVGDARWRLRVAPWDGNAMLAAAWASRRRQDYPRASAQAREAVRMGLPEGPALELEAELLAAQGECERARATFDQALQARAQSAFENEGALATPLALGGFQLPPALVTECGGLEALPGLDDLPALTPPP